MLDPQAHFLGLRFTHVALLVKHPATRTMPLVYYLGLSAILFSIGVAGVLLRRNAIVIFMSIELMLNAVNISFVAFAAHWKNLEGQIFVFFVLVIAAAEVAIGLALIVAIFRMKQTIYVDEINLMKW
jgi:NADH-quinone oxidoreductase subunit K